MAYFETVLASVLVVIGLCVARYMWNLYNSRNKYHFPPGPPAWPIIGNVLSLDLSRLHVSLVGLTQTYGDAVCIHVFNQKIVVLNTIELIEHVFVKDGEVAIATAGRNKTFLAKYLYTDFQSITFQTSTPQQQRMRRLFIKALHMYGEGVHSNEAIIQEELRNNVLHELTNQNGHAFDPDDIIYPSLINIMCILMLGKCFGKDDSKFKTIKDTLAALLTLFNRDIEMVLSAFPFMRHITFFKYGQYYQEAIRARQRFMKVLVEDAKAGYSPDARSGMMDEAIHTMMKLEENGDPQWITDSTLEGIALDSFGAGTQTTRNSLLSLFLALVNFPQVAGRIQRELDNVIGESRMPCLRDRENMPYLNAVVLEMFRTAPVAPMLMPHMATQDITFQNYVLPKGTMIMANAWNVHYEETIFPNSTEFLPERFLDDHGKLLPIEHERRRRVIPFSIGRRSCPGDTFAKSRLFLYIATILQRFNLVADTICPPYEPVNFAPVFLTRPGPYKIKAIPR